MKVYLDVSCLNRPFDDQSQPRIHREAEAVLPVLDRCETANWTHVASAASRWEIDAGRDMVRRNRVALLLPEEHAILELTEPVFARAEQLEELGFAAVDAVHLAAAESMGTDVFLSCDDRLCRRAARHATKLKVQVANPLDWLTEVDHVDDA
jgi:predicted nucleic acid-binding protein